MAYANKEYKLFNKTLIIYVIFVVYDLTVSSETINSNIITYNTFLLKNLSLLF